MAKIVPGKHATKRDVITKKASSLFRIKGYNAASMRDLAEAVGVEAPSLYNHIGSKSELLQTICFKVANEFTTHLDTTEAKTGKMTGKIESIIRFHIHMMMEDFDEVFVANHEWKHLQEPYLSNFLNQRRGYEKRFLHIIEEGARKNELKNINPFVALLTILSAVRGLEFWQRHKKNISVAALENDMVNHLLKGIIK